VERKLTAILCADVHGYSRLGENEEATVRKGESAFQFECRFKRTTNGRLRIENFSVSSASCRYR
jgi:hypothetical protein